MGTRLLNTLSSILASAGIGFSSRYNAKYGMRHLVAMLAEMCASGTTAEAAAANLEGHKDMPSARWLRDMIKTVSKDNAEKACNEMLRRTVRIAGRGGEGGMARAGPMLVAIDKHLIPRHDRNNMLHLVYSKIKGGTNRFECYATMQAVAGSINAVLDCVPVTRDCSDVDFVRRFVNTLRKCRVKARLLLMDREFYSTDVMLALNESHSKFLMPAVKNAGIKRAVTDYHNGRIGAVSRYTMRNSKKREVTFTLIIRPSKKYDDADAAVTDRYVVFATSLPARRVMMELSVLPDEYRYRWGIETGYRQVEQVRPRTYSRDHLFRMMMFYVALFVHNMWAIERHRAAVPPGRMTLRIVISAAAAVAVLQETVGVGVPYDPGGQG